MVLVVGVAVALVRDDPADDEVDTVDDAREHDRDEQDEPTGTGLPAIGTATTAPSETGTSDSTSTTAPSSPGGPGAGGGPATPAPGGDGGSGGGVTPGAPIRIGMVGSFSSDRAFPGSSSLGSGLAVLERWAATVNSFGGLAGHPVELVAAEATGASDDAERPYRTLVEEAGVVAFVGDLDLTARLPMAYLESVGVPVLAPALTTSAYSSRNAFPVGAGPAGLAEGLADVAVANGWDDVAVVRCTLPHCADVGDAFRDAAASAGVRVSHDVAIPVTTTNLPSCGGDAMVVLGDAGFVDRMADACAQPVLTTSMAVTDGVLEDGVWAVSPVLPHPVSSTPGAAAYRTLLDAMPDSYTAIDGQQRPLVEGFATSSAFASALLLDRAAAVGDWGFEVTSDELIGTLGTVGGDTLGGLVPPLGIRPGQVPADPGCWYVATTAAGRWTAPAGDVPAC